MTRGEDAERLVHERLRAALPSEYHLYANVAWTGPTRDGGPAVDGEADLVIAHPDHGILVLEVKAGEPSRDAQGRWWLGPIQLERSPFEQAMRSQHELVRKLVSLPGWPSERGADHQPEPHAGHGVAFPDVDLASLPRGHVLLGADAPIETVLDATALETAASGSSQPAQRLWLSQRRPRPPPVNRGSKRTHRRSTEVNSIKLDRHPAIRSRTNSIDESAPLPYDVHTLSVHEEVQR